MIGLLFDAQLDAERGRLSEWCQARGLERAADGRRFTGVTDALHVELEMRCKGSSPSGPILEIAARGLPKTPLALTATSPGAHPLSELFDDPTLDGALRSIAVDGGIVRLRFAPGRSTEVLDVALHRFREIHEGERASAERAVSTRLPYR